MHCKSACLTVQPMRTTPLSSSVELDDEDEDDELLPFEAF